MSGDLEDFLRRAAQRRQAKEAQQQSSQRPPRQKPQYSNRRTERMVEPVEEVVVAEVIEEPISPLAEAHRRVEEAKRAAAQAEAELATKSKGQRKSGVSISTTVSTGNPGLDLVHMLSNHGGLRQAILLNEILERPEHRW